MIMNAKSFYELPLVLNVKDITKILGVSQVIGYRLMRQEGFPAVRVGERRLVVPRDRFLQWLDEQANEKVY